VTVTFPQGFYQAPGRSRIHLDQQPRLLPSGKDDLEAGSFMEVTVRRTSLLIVLLVAIPLWADQEAVQSDWSAGPGEQGPVPAWGGGFLSELETSWLTIPGQLALSSEPLEVPRRHHLLQGHPGAYGLYVADMDLDGDPDLIVTTDSSAEVLLLVNQGGSPPAWEVQVVDADYPGGTSVHPADLDGDGDLDLAGAAQTPGHNVVWWRNDGGDPMTWTRLEIQDNFTVACNVFSADVDGDGDMDVLSTSWGSRHITWWRNDGGDPIAWMRQNINGTSGGAHSAWAGDVDGDGDTDVVGTEATENKVVLFVNGGGMPITWGQQVVGSDMVGVRYACFADVDRDGRMDIASAGADGQVAWWRNGGGDPIAWTKQTVDDACEGGHYISVADLDGDGRNDLLVAAYTLSSIQWYRNGGGEPVEWTRREVVTGFASALTAVAADLDGDGDLDVAGTAWESGEVAWWEITDFRSAGELESPVLDLGGTPDLVLNDTGATETDGSGLTVRVRSSHDPADLGGWIEVSEQPDVVSPAGRFLQYQVALCTEDPMVSPIVRDMTVAWTSEPEQCIPGPTTLCLNRGRFRCEVEWRAHDQTVGAGQVVPFAADDSGLFWFFDENNWEMLVKVLDGCAVNQHYWVFAAATTDVEYALTVTDSVTGAARTWTNPMGVSSPAITDTEAFGVCE